jgi:hypothetical protein
MHKLLLNLLLALSVLLASTAGCVVWTNVVVWGS